MKRSIRQLVAGIAIVGVVFAQIATAAYARTSAPDGAVQALALAGVPASGGGGHCAGLAPAPSGPPGNVCEVHCTDVAALSPAPDLPPVVLTPLPVDLLPLASLAASAEHGRVALAALPGAPPPSLAFCRLLI